MQTQRRTLFILGAAVLVTAGWYAFRPERLFIDQVVSEDFPVVPGGVAASSEMDEADMPLVTVAESLDMTAVDGVLVTGAFHSNAHETKGTATIYELEDGRRILRLTGFATSNGPDVRVLLVAAPDVNNNQTVTAAGFVDLGALKGNIGDQNYEVSASLDLSQYRSVTIWCRRFSVNFGTAPLASAQS